MKIVIIKKIILFDGVCNLCSFSVEFIIRHDPNALFSFASVESKVGEELLKQYGLKEVDSLVLIEENQAFVYSDTVLGIAKGLPSWHRYLFIFHYLPRGFRDVVYRFIAKHRYSVFGKKESCMIPTDEVLSRFIVDAKLYAPKSTSTLTTLAKSRFHIFKGKSSVCKLYNSRYCFTLI